MWPFPQKPPAFEGAAKPIMGNFNLTAQLPNGRGVQISGYIFDKESQESLNDRLDVLQECIERQRCRAEIPELETKKEQLVGHLKGLEDALEDLQAKQRREHLASADILNIKNYQTNIKRITEEIDRGSAAIEVAKRKAGMGA